jgi:hypothetical protein
MPELSVAVVAIWPDVHAADAAGGGNGTAVVMVVVGIGRAVAVGAGMVVVVVVVARGCDDGGLAAFAVECPHAANAIAPTPSTHRPRALMRTAPLVVGAIQTLAASARFARQSQTVTIRCVTNGLVSVSWA